MIAPDSLRQWFHCATCGSQRDLCLGCAPRYCPQQLGTGGVDGGAFRMLESGRSEGQGWRDARYHDIYYLYIYIYHEISLAMSWMLPDELVLISNKLLIETPRSETKRNRIAVILGGSVYWAYVLPVLVQQWASSSFQDGTCCTSLYGAVRTRTVFVPGWTEVWLQWKSHNVGNPRPKTIKNHVQ